MKAVGQKIILLFLASLFMNSCSRMGVSDRDNSTFDGFESAKITDLVIEADTEFPADNRKPITWTVSAKSEFPLKYQFWVYNGDKWKIKPYSSSPTFKWVPNLRGANLPQVFLIHIWVREDGSLKEYESSLSTRLVVVIPSLAATADPGDVLQDSVDIPETVMAEDLEGMLGETEPDPTPEPTPTPEPEAEPTPPPPPSNRLGSGQQLRSGESLESSNGRFELMYQGDGNLVLRDIGQAIWDSQTNGMSAGSLQMQSGGNLVIYDSGPQAIWSSRTNHAGSSLLLQNDGNLVIEDSSGDVIWGVGAAGSYVSFSTYQNDGGNGYNCHIDGTGGGNRDYTLPIGERFQYSLSCVSPYGPQGNSRIYNTSGDIIRFCNETSLGGGNWSVDCGNIPADIDFARYWNGL
jgi:hypothetical protein